MRLWLRVPLALLLLTLLAACAARRSSAPPPSASGADSKTRQEAFDASVEDVVKRIGAPRSDIAGVSQEDVTWQDSCLGCPQTGEMCSQVLTPGYKIILRVRDATYEYHSNRGDRVRLCGQSAINPPPATARPTF